VDVTEHPTANFAAERPDETGQPKTAATSIAVQIIFSGSNAAAKIALKQSVFISTTKG
jgi:hypothetical protein